jgi:hypothetical protein
MAEQMAEDSADLNNEINNTGNKIITRTLND